MRGNATALGLGKNRLQRGVDHLGLGLGPLTSVSAWPQLVGDVDQPAGVDGKVRRVEEALSVKGISVFGGQQLVISPTADDPATQVGDRVAVENPASRAGSKDVTLLSQNLLGFNHARL